jgi:hypothetical protein
MSSGQEVEAQKDTIRDAVQALSLGYAVSFEKRIVENSKLKGLGKKTLMATGKTEFMTCASFLESFLDSKLIHQFVHPAIWSEVHCAAAEGGKKK